MRVFQPGERYRYASVKRDGHSLTMYVRGANVTVYSKRKELTSQLKWADWYRLAVRRAGQQPWEGFLILYGELWLPGGTSSDVPQAIKQRNPNLQFDVWGGRDDPTLSGKMSVLSARDPFSNLESIADAVGQHVVGWENIAGREIVPADWLAKCGLDVEGFVFSNGNMADYCKLKPIQSADLIVTTVVPGAGKFAGKIGALVLQTRDGQAMGNVGSGLTNSFRQPGSILTGDVVEVAFNGLTSTGKPRFPRFLRLRLDKTAAEADTLESVRLMTGGR